jgi:methanogenic corrinoid protein MtbC1
MRDVALVRRMHRLSLQGMPLIEAAGLARSEAVTGGAPQPEPTLSQNIFTALTNWDEATAAAHWMEMLDRMDLQAAFDRVVAPLLREVGTAWHDGAITIAQEHFASNFVRSRIDYLSRQIIPLDGAPTVLLACPEGEHHKLGLLMLSVLLRFQGMRTVYLGRDVPAEELVRTSQDAPASVVVLNASTSDASARIANVVPVLREACPQISIVFGGGAFDSSPETRTISDAVYGGPDLASAVVLINQFGRRVRRGGSR